MKTVQMDRLDFSDHFSYIIYLIWIYRLISMNFWSLNHFLEFPGLFLIQKIVNRVSTTSLWRQHWPKSNLTGGLHLSLTQGVNMGYLTGWLAPNLILPRQHRRIKHRWRGGSPELLGLALEAAVSAAVGPVGKLALGRIQWCKQGCRE